MLGASSAKGLFGTLVILGPLVFSIFSSILLTIVQKSFFLSSDP
ncbi:hypothetical protein LEP1GSC188_1195 [Leptospira weilii serovar Topaz str. LT2116]|uniref:Uncharacterized protein n=1 Tax=Leptospira weilii serovar Topaz str. LT2116 TaxID=1088540 RepID=M3GC53_9LEPT|nr:hypothetical protein LEP1GSC188_1195 [Leptospira weilii serovar Topaz str. LT2116]